MYEESSAPQLNASRQILRRDLTSHIESKSHRFFEVKIRIPLNFLKGVCATWEVCNINIRLTTFRAKLKSKSPIRYYLLFGMMGCLWKFIWWKKLIKFDHFLGLISSNLVWFCHFLNQMHPKPRKSGKNRKKAALGIKTVVAVSPEINPEDLFGNNLVVKSVTHPMLVYFFLQELFRDRIEVLKIALFLNFF